MFACMYSPTVLFLELDSKFCIENCIQDERAKIMVWEKTGQNNERRPAAAGTQW